MTSLTKKKLIGATAACYGIAMLLIFGCSRTEESGMETAEKTENAKVKSHPMADWKDPATCLKCHEDEHKSWISSHHANANRFVDPEMEGYRYEVGEFKDIAGREYRVDVDGERLLISEKDADGEYIAAEAKAVIGTTPLQQPLVEGERGRWQAHSMAWDMDENEWFNVFRDEERFLGEWGHWTGQGMNWNSNCAWCHTTEYEKNYDPETDSYASTWTHQGITCISCHTTGMEEHVAIAGTDDYVSPPKVEMRRMVENCGSCHARREELTDSDFRVGDHFEDHYRLMLYDHPTAYFEDGKADEEDFVFGSLMHSQMGHAGVTCMECHDPHSVELKLPADNNATCIQCHSTGRMDAQIVDLLNHSFHPINSTGNSCVECHMPERDYMARDPRRDHGFTIPDPYMAKHFDVPDACSKCHDDKSTDELLSWFEEKWGDSERVADLRDRAHTLNEVWTGEMQEPSKLLARLEKTENPYWKASWLRMMRPFSPIEEVKEAAMKYAKSEHPLVRDSAIFVLGTRPDALEQVQAALVDERRIVRMQAADTLAGSPFLTGDVLEEYETYIQSNSDRPSGALKLAAYAATQGNIEDVRKYGELAISFDRKAAAIRYDVSILMDRVGLVDEAIKQMRIAHGYDSSTGLYLFSTGLLYAEKEEQAQAIDYIKRALKIEPDQHRWLFNLSVLQTRTGDVPGAIESLRKAIALAPEETAYTDFFGQLTGGQ
ncbi:cytochrome c3 family protein [Pelagicoccus mobilis]|uniref:Doubled CXXCH motif domain-containing protein n=1 Tax=Pelagicoccus mobilis TaxID=415221 RepID=A0A934RT77_9BACT|nr:tetratricopeptide repeat protein [Pelagicoccus mobilis]MBK1875998.1 hypothetical protein [Pelagicoccus mobilis]